MKHGSGASDFRVPRGLGLGIGLLAVVLGELMGLPRWASIAIAGVAVLLTVSQMFARHQAGPSPVERPESNTARPSHAVTRQALDGEAASRQRMRSIAIGLGLALLAVVFYVATIVRLGPNALKKDSFGNPTQPAASAPAKGVPVGGPEPQCRRAGTC